ncbi:MAG: hypothetical protein LAO79_23615 [Acidobacteriia bacterium]|nr:hypothetical protein [Terriglobia bacterium]
MMDDLERQLGDALGRKEPSAGFEHRVLAAVERSKKRPWFSPRFQWAAAIAASLVMIAGVVRYREAEERAAGEAAKLKLELALKITSEKLQKIQDRVNQGNQE